MSLGRITNVLANGNAIANYSFDIIGNLQSLKYANGVTNLYQYDAMNRLTNQVWKAGGTTLGSFAYTLGSTGNRIALAETVNGTGHSYTWSYDDLYRLTGENLGSLGTVNYKYDSVGNRTNRTSTITQLSNTNSSYNANDWLVSDNYDYNGNTTVSSANVYEYDVMNRLTNVNSGSIVIGYDGDGNRVKKTAGGVTTYYLVDEVNPSGYAQVLEEYRGTTLTNVYNYALDLISQRVPGTSTNYFIYDGHGSTRVLTDIGGNVVNAFTYDAYGTLIASNGAPQTVYLYCGQQFDVDLGLYYNRARYLNTGTGRFWAMDTYEGDNDDPLSLHKYLYCKSNPANGIDPSGKSLEGFLIGIVIGAVAIGVVDYFFVEDHSVSAMQTIPQSAIIAEYNKQQSIITSLTEAAAANYKLPANQLKPLSAYGLQIGGRYNTAMVNNADPSGQKIRNIWERRTTVAGRASAANELAARVQAGFHKNDFNGFIRGMADPSTTAIDGATYAGVLEALADRQSAYQSWLKGFIK